MPTYKMPDAADRRRAATIAAARGAVRAARCAVELAGMESSEFVVRELLLTALAQLGQAASALGRLSPTSSVDAFP
jgi:hypothetical protein